MPSLSKVSFRQQCLDEFDYSIKNLAVDLRDGIRLVRLAEIWATGAVLPGSDSSLSQKLRVPVVSRLQKLHNVKLALQHFQATGVKLIGSNQREITAKDIAEGNRTQTLSLLWGIIATYNIPAIINSKQIQKEIKLLMAGEPEAAIVELKASIAEDPTNSHLSAATTVPAISLLLQWCAAVCNLFNMRVTNFTSSFADGRALCYLIHYYHPALLPLSMIHKTTTSGPCTNNKWDDANLETLSAEEYEAGLCGERNNFALVNLIAQKLGCIPMLISSWNSTNLPEEKVMVIFLAHICVRLLESRTEIRATRVIQRLWRRFTMIRRFEAKRELICRIQRFFRHVVRSKQQRVRTEAANMLQYWFRVQVPAAGLLRQILAIGRTSLLTKQQIRERSATVIQAALRCYVAKMNVKKWESAATVLQAFSRGRAAWRNYSTMLQQRHASSVRISAWWRATKGLQTFCKHKASSIRVQKEWRRFVRHREWCKTILAATVLQERIRKLLVRRADERKAAAIVTLQTRVRSWQAKKLFEHTKLRHQAATKLQTALRRFVKAKNFQSVLKGVILLQSAWRRQRCTRAYESLRCAVLVGQKNWRAISVQRRFTKTRNSVLVLQSRVRAFLAQQHFKRARTAATAIQKSARRAICAKRFASAKSSAIRLQTMYRSKHAAKQFVNLKLSVVALQTAFRSSVQQRRFKGIVAAVTLMQKLWRQVHATKIFQTKRKGVVSLQSAWRRAACMRTYRSMLELRANRSRIVIVQKLVRRFLVLRTIARTTDAVQRVQAVWRLMLSTRKARHWWSVRRHASTTIAKAWRDTQTRQAKQDQRRRFKLAVSLQALVRGTNARVQHKRRVQAAKNIQRLLRMRQKSKNYSQFKRAMVVLQKVSRAHKVRTQYNNLRRVTRIIQRRCRDRQRMLISHKRAVLSLQRVWRGSSVRASHADVVDHLKNFSKMFWLSKFEAQAVKVNPEKRTKQHEFRENITFF